MLELNRFDAEPSAEFEQGGSFNRGPLSIGGRDQPGVAKHITMRFGWKGGQVLEGGFESSGIAENSHPFDVVLRVRLVIDEGHQSLDFVSIECSVGMSDGRGSDEQPPLF